MSNSVTNNTHIYVPHQQNIQTKKAQLKQLYQQKTDIKDKSDNPELIKLGLKSFLSPMGMLGLATLAKGTSLAIRGMAPTPLLDLSPIIQTDPLTAQYMNAYPVPSMMIIPKNPAQEALERQFLKMSNFADKTSDLCIQTGFDGFSREERQAKSQKNMGKLIKKFDADIKKLEREIAILGADNSLNSLIANKKESFTYPELTNINSCDDFTTHIETQINDKDSEVSKLYAEFSDVNKNIDDDDTKKDIFTNSLFNNILKVKFDNSFNQIQGIDAVKNDAFIGKLKNNPDYLNILFNNPNAVGQISTLMEKMKNDMLGNPQDGDMQSYPPGKFLDRFVTYRQGLEDDTAKQQADTDLMKYIALKHVNSLKDNSEYGFMQERRNIFQQSS